MYQVGRLIQTRGDMGIYQNRFLSYSLIPAEPFLSFNVAHWHARLKANIEKLGLASDWGKDYTISLYFYVNDYDHYYDIITYVLYFYYACLCRMKFFETAIVVHQALLHQPEHPLLY